MKINEKKVEKVTQHLFINCFLLEFEKREKLEEKKSWSGRK